MFDFGIVLVALIGLLVGSFLNVVILRLHAGKQFIKGRSECPHCKHKLAWYDNIPVLSWIILRGKCRYCRKPISLQYPLVELLTSALFVVSYTQFQSLFTFNGVIAFILWAYIIGSFVVLAVYDIKWYLLPDKVLLPLIIPALAMGLSAAIISGSAQPLLGPLAAGLLFGGCFYLLAAVSGGKWMGGGDIKLAFVMGLLLGLQKTSLAMFIAFISGSIIGLIIVALRKNKSHYIPFGPFLIAGTIAAFLYGAPILDWYKGITGLGIIFL